MALHIGINLGTSLDAVDAVLCEFHQTSSDTISYTALRPQSLTPETISSISIIASVSVPLDASLREDFVRLISSGCAELASLVALEVRLAIAYEAAVHELLFKWMNEQKKGLPGAHECHALCSERVRVRPSVHTDRRCSTRPIPRSRSHCSCLTGTNSRHSPDSTWCATLGGWTWRAADRALRSLRFSTARSSRALLRIASCASF